jgi:hypothetical protein
MLRHCITCFLERERSGCLGQDFDWPPGSQPSLQRTRMLRSEWDMGSQSIGSKDKERQQRESNLK